MRTQSLKSLGEQLSCSTKGAMNGLKSVLLRDIDDTGSAPIRLELSTAQDVAHLLALATILAEISNQKSPLTEIKKEFSGNDLIAEYNLFDARLPLQSLVKDKDGKIDLKGGLPVAEVSGKKLAPYLQDLSMVMKELGSVNFQTLVNGSAFVTALNSIATHPTKLAAPAGSGGFIISHMPSSPLDFGHLTEADFKTNETITLACNAAYQKMWLLLLPFFYFEGLPCRLFSLLKNNPVVAAGVRDVFERYGVPSANLLLDAFQTVKPPAFEGEPQVFCGDLPHVTSVSVFTPYGLFSEIYRAKRQLSDAYSLEQADIVASIDTKIGEATTQLDAIALLPSNESKTPVTRAKKVELTSLLKDLKADRKSVSSKFLNLRSYSLLIGGATPRNMALDLDTSIHNSNIQAFIPTAHRKTNPIGTRVLVNGVFVVKALMGRVDVPSFKGLPKYLGADAIGFENKMTRLALFADLIAMAMSPLLSLQYAWLHRADELIGDVPLRQAALDSIYLADTDWSLFVKGDPTKNTAELMREFKPLANQVFTTVKSALDKAFEHCKPNLSNAHDEELFELVSKTIAQERA